MLLTILLLASVTVRTAQTPLRAGCDGDSGTTATLAEGQQVWVRFALQGDTPCYKVMARVDGREITGYLGAGDLAGLDEFDRDRQQAAADTGSVKVTAAQVDAVQDRVAPAVLVDPRFRPAVDAIRQNEPARALALLEPVLRLRADANVLVLAGVAAWRNDEPRVALDYWKRSLDLRPDPQVERLCRDAQREAAGDRSSAKAYGLRVVLRYEPELVGAATARAMVAALDTEWTRISAELGCVSGERLVAIAQSRQAYLASTGAAEWSGGRYDGRIRVALMDDSALGDRTQQAFAHELVHACLATLGQWPAWLHEGLAQKFSGARLSDADSSHLDQMIAARKFPRLEELGRDMGRMDAATAQWTYKLALRAADLMADDFAGLGLRNVLHNPALFGQVTAGLNRRLGL